MNNSTVQTVKAEEMWSMFNTSTEPVIVSCGKHQGSFLLSARKELIEAYNKNDHNVFAFTYLGSRCLQDIKISPVRFGDKFSFDEVGNFISKSAELSEGAFKEIIITSNYRHLAIYIQNDSNNIDPKVLGEKFLKYLKNLTPQIKSYKIKE